MRHLLTIVGFLLPGTIHAQGQGASRADSIAQAWRVLDSATLIKEYGPDVPIAAILIDGYDIVSIGNGASPEPDDDTIYLYAPGRLSHTAWIREKTPKGFDKGVEKAVGDCEKDLLKLGDEDWTEVAPHTVGNAILDRLCPRRQHP